MFKNALKQMFTVLIMTFGILVFFKASVFAATYTNPIGPGCDPFVVQSGGSYYMIGFDGSFYYKNAARLQDIANANPYYIWTPPGDTPYSKNIWAPEFHYLDGRWYVYFAADNGENANHRMYVLEGGTDPNNPMNGSYSYKGKMSDSSDQWAIDGTVLTYNGNKYFIWSGWPSASNPIQYLYIAPMSNPWTISEARVEISRPDYDWEIPGTGGINEGPQILIKNGVVSVIYSADGSWTDDYCLGQLKLTGTNPLIKTSWIKKSTPVFQKTTQVFGPGHCSFTKSPNGAEDWIVYHAAKYSGAGWDRNVRMQKFTWNTDNTPDFGTPSNPGTFIAEPAETQQISGKFEAESAAMFNCYASGETNASGGQVAGHIDYADSYVQFTVNVAVSGKYLLNVRNCNGCGVVSSHNVYVNGNQVGTINYAAKGWNVFTTSAMLINLNEGSNTIKLMKGTSYAEIDFIEISDRFEGENAMLNRASIDGESYASGAKVVGHIDYTDSYVEFYVNVPTAGKYLLNVGNCNGCGVTASHGVYVNGAAETNLYYYADGWNDFTEASTIITLNAGNNIIKLQKGTSYAEIDYIKLSKIENAYEAENATMFNCYASGESNASGGQVAGHIDYADSYIQFTVNVAAAGIYTLDIRNCNGCSGYSSHALFVNNSYAGYTWYQNMGWNLFTVTSVRVKLNAGSNTIKLQKGANYAEIDYIQVR